MKTKVTYEVTTDEVPNDLRAKLQIAAESIITHTCFRNEPWSSRVLADDIVNMVLDSLAGKPIPTRKPWEPFAVKTPDDCRF